MGLKEIRLDQDTMSNRFLRLTHLRSRVYNIELEHGILEEEIALGKHHSQLPRWFSGGRGRFPCLAFQGVWY